LNEINLLVHSSNQLVDEVFTVTGVTTLDEVQELSRLESTSGVAQLDGPEEVVGSLEVRANSEELVDKILNTDDAKVAQSLLNDSVVMKRNALLVDLSVTTLVDELADGLQVRSTVGDVGLDQLKHLSGSVGKTEEDTVVDLEKTEQLENLAGLGSNVVDTLDTDNEDKLGLGGNVEVTVGLGLTTKTDLISLLSTVFTDILVSALEDDLTLLALSLLKVGDS
jgi:hypothetical protein